MEGTPICPRLADLTSLSRRKQLSTGVWLRH